MYMHIYSLPQLYICNYTSLESLVYMTPFHSPSILWNGFFSDLWLCGDTTHHTYHHVTRSPCHKITNHTCIPNAQLMEDSAMRERVREVTWSHRSCDAYVHRKMAVDGRTGLLWDTHTWIHSHTHSFPQTLVHTNTHSHRHMLHMHTHNNPSMNLHVLCSENRWRQSIQSEGTRWCCVLRAPSRGRWGQSGCKCWVESGCIPHHSQECGA